MMVMARAGFHLPFVSVPTDNLQITFYATF